MSIGCEPIRVSDGRVPYKISDLKLGIRPQQAPFPTLQIAQDVRDQTQMSYQGVRRNAIQAYIKYKAIYGKENQRFKAQRSRLCICLTDERGSLWE